MDFVSVGRWGDLRPGLNVLSVASETQRDQLIRDFESVFAPSATGIESPIVTIAGSNISLDSGLRRTLFEHLSGVSPIVASRAASRSVQPAAISVESVLAVLRALSEPSTSPKEPTVEVFRRIATLEDELAQQAQSPEAVTRVDLATARRDVAALRRWIEQLSEGFSRIDEAQSVVQSHEAAAYKKFAGPTAFNRLLDAQGVRDAIVQEVGFESFEVYQSEKGAVMSDASQRLSAGQRAVAELEAHGLEKRDRSFRPATAELDFLSAHVHFEERYGVDPTKSLAEHARNRTVVRQGFRHQLALFLDSQGIGGSGEVEASAQRYLDANRSQGESVAAGRMELMIKGRIEALAKIPAFAPVPCVLDDVFAGWVASAAHDTFTQLIDTAKNGHQILYVCTREEAMRVSPLAPLFERQQALSA
jgi:hypothetical protein